MAILIVTHEVADFSKWKVGFDGHAAVRNANGVSSTKVYQDTENPNNVTLVAEVGDLQKAKAFFNSPDLKEAMKAGGVTNQPTVTFLNEAK